MTTPSPITIAKKAWSYWSDGHFDGVPCNPAECVTHGETLSKAKYAFYQDLIDLGWGIDFMEVCREFSFRRYPDKDLVRLPSAPVLDQLTDKQRHIIGHANGNSGREPGYRDYYCTSDGDADCERLVDLSLMQRGSFVVSSKTSRYYLLTEDGALAALSEAEIPRDRAESILEPWVSPLVNQEGFLSLDAIKACPEIKHHFQGMSCRIYSSQWGYYWRANASGYGRKEEAGIYSFEDALSHSHHCGPEKGIWYEFITGAKA
ncbi:hypothetical protein [Marinobacterium iners]|uniref:Uncharacterized protein n=1 Tax=Marinobacterium iners DSM 11526 TaxID=1122198 RepID=A0A1H3X9C6_9GAMM|nr:hypothetical protein [Marinobacterium iners]SDZ95997.1 hypothetical protein SAMN02745729_10183 [Marinobacterium iners DSM 11526]